MFYSHSLLSKKGPLGNIWIAAHFHKKLKKEQINLTNISSSVDKILLDQVPVVTYRILGYLLLGIVRIYSKKVEYLFHDCRNVLTELGHFAIGKKSNPPHIEIMCAPYSSITLPERFELDTFDLEVIEDSSKGHMTPHEGSMPKGKDVGMWPQSFDQYYLEEDPRHYECSSAGPTPIKDIYSPYTMTLDVEAGTSHNLRNLDGRTGTFCRNIFSLEECLPPMIFDEPEVSDPSRISPEEHQRDGLEINSLHSSMMVGDDADVEDSVKSVDEEHVALEQAKSSDLTVLEREEIQITSQKHPVLVSIHVAPESKAPNDAGATLPEFMAVRTPATKERARVLKKRKCLYDEMIIIPNKVYKAGIDDPSNLVKKRRKAINAASLPNKAYQRSDLSKMFVEPFIPCVSINFSSLACDNKQKTPEPIEAVEIHATFDQLGSLSVDRTQEDEAIAPSTPVTNSTSQRYSDIRGVTNLDRMRAATLFESLDKEASSSDDRVLDESLMNEELNSCEGNCQEKNNLSSRTRVVARYLYKKFLTRKKWGRNEVVDLSQVLEGKAKKESARLFYELLVLRSGGFVNVKQDNAYGEISVLETTKLKQAVEADGA